MINDLIGQTTSLRKRAELLVSSHGESSKERPPDKEWKEVLHELHVHQIELEMQNEELLRTQRKLEGSQTRYFALYDLAPVGYITLNEDGVIVEGNLAAASMFGLKKNELLAKTISQFIYREDKDSYYFNSKKVMETHERNTWELRMVRADGSRFPARLQASPVCCGEYGITITDITEQKQHAEEREATVELLKICNSAHTLPDLMQDVMHFFQRITACESVGIRLQDDNDCRAGADRQTKTRFRCIRDGYESVALLPLRYRNETYGLLQLNDRKKGLFTREKITLYENLADYISVSMAKLKSDELLKKSQKFNMHIINNAEEGIIVLDTELRYQVWNPYMERLTGLRACDVMGRHPQELFPFLKEIGRLEQLEQILHGEKFSVSEFQAHSPHNNSTGWTLDSSSALKNDVEEIIGVISIVRDITALKQKDETLRKLFVAVEQSPTVIVITNLEGLIEYANPRFARMTGYSIDETIGQNPRILRGDTPDEVYRDLWATISSGAIWEGDFHNRKKDGSLFWEHAIIAPVKNDAGLTTHYLAIKEDSTEKRSLGEQLRQSHKMEAIGQLAGGIAHDFNNKLMVIMGNVELAKMDIHNSSKTLEYLQEIRRAAEHSRDITSRLLAFSRQQVISPQELDANHAIKESLKSLLRLIGEHIAITFEPADKLWRVKMDPVQLDQIVMNLAVNARDAMPDGGKFAIETGNVTLEKNNRTPCIDCVPGDYIRILFRDSGAGMSNETITRIFEPFFTTKEVGKGTGLGLATIYGIVRQNNGYIEVSSRLGYGTEFEIYLPRYDSHTSDAPKTDSTLCSGCGSLLLVEDDDAVRAVASTFLQKIGYTVYESESPGKAIDLAKDFSIKLDLVLTDFIMPEMNGKVMMEKMWAIRPDLTCIFASGYSSDHAVLDETAKLGSNFIQKPYDLIKLSAQLKLLLRDKR